MKGSDGKPGKQVTSYQRFRVSQADWEYLKSPVKGRPPAYLLVEQDVLNSINDAFLGDGFERNKHGIPSSRGGKVVCTITEGKLTGVGVSLCSFSDVFNKQAGYKLAHVRAEHALAMAASLDLPPCSNMRHEVTIQP